MQILERGRWLAWLGLVAAVGCTDPLYDGRVELAGLREPVRIVRDEHAMPYIHAANLEDALFAQGFAMAQDRLFQLDLVRHLANGRLAELGGEGLLERDRLFRTVGLRRIAQQLEPRLEAGPRRTFEAFGRGIDAYIRTQSDNYPVEYQALGATPEPWTLLDTLSVFVYINWNFAGNLGEEVLSQRLVDKLGPQVAAELFPVHGDAGDNVTYHPRPQQPRRRPRRDLAPPAANGLGADRLLAQLAKPVADWRLAGSNAWAVGAARSTSGAPMLASDPHGSGDMIPVPFYPQGIQLPDVRLVGIAILGLPGILTGRNEQMAWGFTNNNADVQDLFVETLHPQDPEMYLEAGEWRPFQRRTEVLRIRNDDGSFTEQSLVVRETPRGPIVTELFPGVQSALSFRWYVKDLLDGRLGLDELMLAKTPEAALTALSRWPGITQNAHLAHKDGWVGWHIMGHVPVRNGHSGLYPVPAEMAASVWDGSSFIPFDEMPHMHDPNQGWTASANHWGYGEDFPYLMASTNGAPYRILRIAEVLEAAGPMSVQDHRGLQLDTLSVSARRALPVFLEELEAVADEDLGWLAAELRGWDGHTGTESIGASLWNALYRHTVLELVRDELGQELADAYLGQAYYFQERFEALLAEPNDPWFDDQGTAAQERRGDIVRRAARSALAEVEERLGSDRRRWQWGRMHQLFFENPVATSGQERQLLGAGPFPFTGDNDTVQRGGYRFEAPYDVHINAAMRMVADMADDCFVLGSITTGVSGRFHTTFYKDQIDAYLGGEGLPWWLCEEQILAHRRHELLLEPGAQEVGASRAWAAALAVLALSLAAVAALRRRVVRARRM